MYFWFVCLFIPYLRLSGTAYEDNNKNKIQPILRYSHPHTFIKKSYKNQNIGKLDHLL